MAGFPQGTIFDVSSVARQLDIPSAFLYKIFQKLTSKKIICSHRGAQGGFSVVKNAGNISVRKIIEIIQGPVGLNKCLVKKSGERSRTKKSCSQQNGCSLNVQLDLIQKKLFKVLDKLTIKKLSRETKFNNSFDKRPAFS